MKKLTVFVIIIISVTLCLSAILASTSGPYTSYYWSGRSLNFEAYDPSDKDIYRPTKSVSINSWYPNVRVTWDVPMVDGYAPYKVAVNIDGGNCGTAYDLDGGCTGTLWIWNVPPGSRLIAINIYYESEDDEEESPICCWGGCTSNVN